MQHSTKEKKRRKNKRNKEHLCINCTYEFKQEVEVIAFIKRFKNVTDFVKSCIANPTQAYTCPLVPSKKKGVSFTKTLFKKQKGYPKEEKDAIRFYVSDEERKRIDTLTEDAGYKYYVDFLLSQLVPVIEENQKQIDEYLDYTENLQEATSSTPNPTPYDSHQIPIS